MPGATHIRWSTHSNSSSGSDYDGRSSYSASTAPTIYSTRYSKQHDENNEVITGKSSDITRSPTYDDSLEFAERTSVETYASSNRSVEEFEEDELPPFDVPDFESETGVATALASTPSEFADYFPSIRKMSIKHDDSTLDGNMNLRVDTLAQLSDGSRADLTLFHLRMHDLKSREFSLRRHCRDSGREVCHSTRKYQKPSIMRRPALQRSMSSAISGFRPKSADGKSTRASLKSQESGYDSLDERRTQDDSSHPSRQGHSIPRPTNTTLLDFSNYSHLEVKRRGARASKRYEFQYWGTSYAWKRVATASGDYKEISYHLVDTKTSASIAHIVPTPLSRSEAREEEAKGGYVQQTYVFIQHMLIKFSAGSHLAPCGYQMKRSSTDPSTSQSKPSNNSPK